jgi:hypothetical protein
MHVVTHLSAEEFVADDGTADYIRTFQVHPTKRINAKSRVGGLPVTVDGDFLIEAISEWMIGERDTEEVEREPVEDEDIILQESPESELDAAVHLE